MELSLVRSVVGELCVFEVGLGGFPCVGEYVSGALSREEVGFGASKSKICC